MIPEFWKDSTAIGDYFTSRQRALRILRAARADDKVKAAGGDTDEERCGGSSQENAMLFSDFEEAVKKLTKYVFVTAGACQST